MAKKSQTPSSPKEIKAEISFLKTLIGDFKKLKNMNIETAKSDPVSMIDSPLKRMFKMMSDAYPEPDTDEWANLQSQALSIAEQKNAEIDIIIEDLNSMIEKLKNQAQEEPEGQQEDENVENLNEDTQDTQDTQDAKEEEQQQERLKKMELLIKEKKYDEAKKVAEEYFKVKEQRIERGIISELFSPTKGDEKNNQSTTDSSDIIEQKQESALSDLTSEKKSWQEFVNDKQNGNDKEWQNYVTERANATEGVVQQH